MINGPCKNDARKSEKGKKETALSVERTSGSWACGHETVGSIPGSCPDPCAWSACRLTPCSLRKGTFRDVLFMGH